jgi:hypothetical protein
VKYGVFKKVKLNFLPKGHTHNDVDQMFSRLSVALQERDVLCMDDLVSICKAAYSPAPAFVHLDNVASFSTLLKAFLPPGMVGHTKPRSFVFARDSAGAVRHHYRMQVQTSKKQLQDSWMPHNGLGLELLPTMPDFSLLKCVPFKPVDLKELRDTVRVLSPYFTHVHLQWWDSTLNQFANEDAARCSKCTALRELIAENAASKNDGDDLRREKAAKNRAAYVAMIEHIEDPAFEREHLLFKDTANQTCFPKPQYQWSDGG